METCHECPEIFRNLDKWNNFARSAAPGDWFMNRNKLLFSFPWDFFKDVIVDLSKNGRHRWKDRQTIRLNEGHADVSVEIEMYLEIIFTLKDV